jgi:hypothetical protein
MPKSEIHKKQIHIYVIYPKKVKKYSKIENKVT